MLDSSNTANMQAQEHQNIEPTKQEVACGVLCYATKGMSPSGGGSPSTPSRRASPNVYLAFFFWFFNGTAMGLATGPAMTAYIYVLTGRSPLLVGIAQAIRGGCNVMCGLPSGFLADSISRSRVLCVASMVMLAAIATTS